MKGMKHPRAYRDWMTKKHAIGKQRLLAPHPFEAYWALACATILVTDAQPASTAWRSWRGVGYRDVGPRHGLKHYYRTYNSTVLEYM